MSSKPPSDPSAPSADSTVQPAASDAPSGTTTSTRLADSMDVDAAPLAGQDTAQGHEETATKADDAPQPSPAAPSHAPSSSSVSLPLSRPKKKPRLSSAPTSGARASRRISGAPAPAVAALPERGQPFAAAPSEEENDAGGESETRGKDGKEYLLCGIYHSPAGLSTPPRIRQPPAADAPGDWRAVVPRRESLLPPPVYHGLTLTELEHDWEDEGEEFELSFPILREFYWGEGRERVRLAEAEAGAGVEGKGKEKGEELEKEQDGAKDKGKEKERKPPPYKYLKTNIYHNRKPDKAAIPAVCSCSLPSDPDEAGLMQYCCDPRLCPCGERCSNLPLSRREGVPEGKDGLRVFWTGNRGFGLKTMVPVKKGQFVIEYRGEIITRDESYRRVLTTYASSGSYYFLDYDGFEVIDAGQRGNSSRFINHSCGPNLQVVRWRLAGVEEYQMGIFALRDIPAGTELTYDYGWQDFSSIAPRPGASVAPTPGPPASLSLSTPSASTPSTSTSTSAAAVTLADPPSPASSALSSPPPSPTPPPPAQLELNDPARQRCFCGSPACSGFLGQRADKAKKGAAAEEGSTGPKGPGRRWVEERWKVGERLPWAAPPGGAKEEVVKVKTVTLDVSSSSSTAAATEARKRKAPPAQAHDEGEAEAKGFKSQTVDAVVGAMRSGREAARRAVGKLLGSAPPVFEED
ncbi:hypothetical protein JCM10213v2_005194 [Rhodosporidiobolus nylandii]